MPRSWSTRWCCARRRKRNTPPRTTGISGSTCAATPISPRRSAAMPDHQDVAALGEIGAQISAAERRAMKAERETFDRLLAHFLADRIGATFEGHISGATRAGLFIKLDDTGADGFIPARTVGDEYFRYHEDKHALIGDRSGETYRLGDKVTVRLVEAAPVAGALRFELLSKN